MADARFFHRAGPFPLGDIATVVGAEPLLPADEAVSIHDIAALESAGPDDISVFTDVRYLDALAPSRAGAIIITRKLAHHAAASSRLIYVDDPRRAYAQVGRLFYPPQALQPGVHPTASVHPSASIGLGAQVDAGAIIGRDVDIGERCHIGANVVVGDGVLIGDDCRIGANSCISHALIGHRVEIETCVTVGSQGFGFVPGPMSLERMLQLGRVVIEEGVKIGANCAIDRGATDDTVIGAGSVLDNLVHIAHNVRLGRHCVICAQVGIAGSTVVGDGVMMGGQTGVADHLTIGARAQIAAKSGVMRDVEPGAVVGGFPAVAIKSWHRQTIGIARLSKKVE
ncbi:MAG: UDP-3-O-(3-hydroxymyristoyl)glucosamine N-acyltransferase [Hyphomicrobium sp.]|uniref:UDP-3-O-(3-hydroxymyristoyl)glucosamine N-acyltransferase n=1 Tax=Hyphomicrobium sp. TaxID=82 RepID=UPI0013296EFB|nr:UDP-3-O-(3-hydroxymyristoyl)glucosamine N-acyltransferase [Hyphomicrobium sp.]KAB2941989.1 MAG: UDP-3-O-(3-hydroxymyristoyl)glucosamine N-acyltransferase [Hyphomicrobium sp.]MBZ0211317.1 UDP-3-O-(3-hydroxymyristoyl)glucosamine N-acyltransferase [Hyphomicrobium sp.]